MPISVARGLVLAIALTVSSGLLAEPCEPGWGDSFLGMLNEGSFEHVVEFDDGRGPALFFSGSFYLGGETELGSFVRVAGGRVELVPFDLLADTDPTGMIVHDDGSGPAIYASGNFQRTLGGTQYGVVRWKGDVWEPVGAGMRLALGLAVFDEDGDGPSPARLFACGPANSGSLGGVERWDGVGWTTVGGESVPQAGRLRWRRWTMAPAQHSIWAGSLRRSAVSSSMASRAGTGNCGAPWAMALRCRAPAHCLSSA